MSDPAGQPLGAEHLVFSDRSSRPLGANVLDLTGTSSVVTGGASGLGEATARLLAARGASVVIADLQDDKGKAVAGSLGGAYVHTDVTDPDQVIEAVTAASELGPLRSLT